MIQTKRIANRHGLLTYFNAFGGSDGNGKEKDGIGINLQDGNIFARIDTDNLGRKDSPYHIGTALALTTVAVTTTVRWCATATGSDDDITAAFAVVERVERILRRR